MFMKPKIRVLRINGRDEQRWDHTDKDFEEVSVEEIE
jgi:hypothetical protein